MTLISVLSKAEAKEFDEPPIFNSIDRKRFYNLNAALQNTIDKLRTPTNKVCFLTLYAYFKAQKRFYDGKFQEQDINYACRLLNIDTALVSLNSYSRKIRLDHQLLIMNILGYSPFNDSANDNLNNLVYQHVKSYKSPRLVFAEMLDYLLLNKIIIPRYRQFANIISAQLHKYKSDINECLTNCLDKQIKLQLKYRDINDYLIPLEQWNAKRDDYIKQAGLEDFVDIEKLLSEYETEMKESFAKVNNLILKENTPYINTRLDGSFILRTPKLEEKETHSISSILPYKKDIPIQNVLSVIASQTAFPKYFLHDTPSMQHRNPENNTLFATLMSYGCNVGIPRMARITKGQSQAALENVARQYMHIDNIKRENDSVLKKIDEVSDYFITSDLRHTSSDGQKYNIDGCSLNANYSFKYFGKGQGVSSYTFVDDRFAHFYATVISSSEREATYVLDGIMHNQVVKSDIHSTDSHGFTEAMFGLMHMAKVTFAPRFKNLSDQTLYGFKSTKLSKNDFIVPKKYIKSDLVIPNYDDILRFATTIKLRFAPASQLFKRLNSYSKQHILYKALKEFGRLRKTMFILRYMYDLAFRQAIEKQLNRGENSNKFSKAVAFGNNQEIIFEEKEDQEIAENCRQLIKNCIILWNYLYLIKMLQSDDQALAQYALIVLQKGNVLAWKHILLHGEYDLSLENTNDEFGLMDPKITALIHTKFWET